jgi:hypothetical protein
LTVSTVGIVGCASVDLRNVSPKKLAGKLEITRMSGVATSSCASAAQIDAVVWTSARYRSALGFRRCMRSLKLKSCDRCGILRLAHYAIKALPDDRRHHVERDAIHSRANNLIKITTDDTYENPIEGTIIPKAAATKTQRCSARRGASLHPCV